MISIDYCWENEDWFSAEFVEVLGEELLMRKRAAGFVMLCSHEFDLLDKKMYKGKLYFEMKFPCRFER